MSIKFTASGSSSTGHNPLLVKMTQFGKGAKEEKRSPSTQRVKTAAAGKLCEEDAIEAATPTQGVELNLAEKAEADKKRHT